MTGSGGGGYCADGSRCDCERLWNEGGGGELLGGGRSNNKPLVGRRLGTLMDHRRVTAVAVVGAGAVGRREAGGVGRIAAMVIVRSQRVVVMLLLLLLLLVVGQWQEGGGTRRAELGRGAG